MTINQLAINTEGMRFRFVSSVSHHEYRNEQRLEEQTRDSDTGYPLWKVRVSIVDTNAETATTATVTVAAVDEPTAEFDSPVSFEDLTVRFWVMNQMLGQSFTAKAMTTPTPTKPPTTTTATAATRKAA